MDLITLFVVTLVLGGVSGVCLHFFREAEERSDSRENTGPAADVGSQQVPPSGQC